MNLEAIPLRRKDLPAVKLFSQSTKLAQELGEATALSGALVLVTTCLLASVETSGGGDHKKNMIS